MKKISIVIPAHNEEGNVSLIRQRIADVFSKLEHYKYEIIFVNDGSRDNTQQKLEELAAKFDEVKYIEFSRNFGHQPAVKAGIDCSNGNAVISMDADLQHPPELIPEMIKRWEEGFDIVYTVRTYPKKISAFKRKTSDFYYKFLASISDVNLSEGGGSDFRLMDASVVDVVRNMNESDIFLRGLSNWMGFKQTGIHFLAGERASGESSYNLKKMMKFAFTGITAFSVKPLYLAAYLGFLFSAFAIVGYGIYVIHSFWTKTEISGWASLIMTVVFFGGIQLIILGIIGIYLGKIFKQVKERPNYIIRSKIFNIIFKEKFDDKMKIAFDGKRFFSNSSGLGNYSRDLVRVLANYFPENDYILLNKSQSERGREILDLPNVSFKQIAKGNFSRQLKMGKDAQKIDADIFHGLSGELPLKWDKKPIKKIVTIHDLIFERFPQYYSFFDRKMHLWKFRKAVEKADVVIAISEQTKRDVIHYLKVPESKVKVVYQGCHQAFKEFIFPEFLNQTKEKYNLPQRFILNVGTIEERKNLLNVIKALKATKIPLVVVGKKQKKYFQKIEKEIRKNGVEVQFLEHVSMNELAAIYRLSDIFIYPSLFEGFGIPVIEALFSGTPVITSNVSCLPEAGGKDSMYVNPLSVEDIRSKVLHLWENDSERKRRREKSFDFVQQFKDEAIAQELMKIYKDIL